VAAHGTDARSDRCLEQIAGEPRVFADQDAGRTTLSAAGDVSDGASESQSELGRHRVNVSHPSDAVGTEDAAGVGRTHGAFLLPEVDERKFEIELARSNRSDRRLQVIPNCKQAMIEDAGHMLHHDQPEELAKLIEPFFLS
jgi:pimeloyl-ACP methyl ester carboxylesterase